MACHLHPELSYPKSDRVKCPRKIGDFLNRLDLDPSNLDLDRFNLSRLDILLCFNKKNRNDLDLVYFIVHTAI